MNTEELLKPVLFAVDDDPDTLAKIERELLRRYGSDYRVIATSLPGEALETLGQFEAKGERVALLIADQWMPGLTGVEFLIRAHGLHPTARRILLTAYGDTSATSPLLRAMTLGQIDYFLGKPWGPPEERLYPEIGELLSEWTRATSSSRLELLRTVGAQWSPRSHELRDLLERNNLPYGFYAAESEEGSRLLQEAGCDATLLPIVLFYDGRVLVDPSNKEIADAVGVKTSVSDEIYDVAIIGAGPAGLAAAVYGASEGLRTLILEREAVGGQAGTTSLIRNYLGFPRGVSGAELAGRASEQAVLFGADFVYVHEAIGLRAEGPHRKVTLTDGSEATSRAVLVATGVSYRRLDAQGVDELVGSGVFYGAAVAEAHAMQGQDVFVVGAGNSAGQAAVHLSRFAARVTLVVRGDSPANSMSDYLIKEIDNARNISVRRRTIVAAAHGQGRLDSLTLEDVGTGERTVVTAVALFVLIGAAPRTEWLADTLERDDHGFVLTGLDLAREGRLPAGWMLDRPPLLLETSMPGVFAAGDVRHRSVKRVASAVGEGSIAIQMIHEYLGSISKRELSIPTAVKGEEHGR